jgi:tetratricopeptide (TPR) repeat protein
MIYLKNNESNKALIEKFGMGDDRKRDIWKGLQPAHSSVLPQIITKIFNPFFQNRDYKEVDQEVIAAHLYYTIGASELGLTYCDKSSSRKANFRAYEIKALINAQQYFDPKTEADKKEALLQTAMKSFDSALSLKADALESLYGKAVLLMEKQEFAKAAPLLQEAQKIAPQNPAIQQKLSECYDKMKVK